MERYSFGLQCNTEFRAKPAASWNLDADEDLRLSFGLRTSIVQTAPDKTEVALTSYLGVEGLNYLSRDGILFLNSKIRLTEITDGTSSTMIVGERPPSADFQFGWWYGGTGQREIA